MTSDQKVTKLWGIEYVVINRPEPKSYLVERANELVG